MAPKKRPPIERFTEHTRRSTNGCVEWTAYRGENGYGRFYLDGHGLLAHRWSYEYHVGPIPAGLVIDHLCRNHACVNPEHLEPVTAAENVRRGIGPELRRRYFSAQTHCRLGHPYDDENIRAGRGRRCLTCKRNKNKEHYEQNRERYIARADEWRRANPQRAREMARDAQRRCRARKKQENEDGS